MLRAKGLPRSLPTGGHPRFCGLSWCARGPVGRSGRRAELVRRFAAWYEIANVEEQFRRFAGEPA
jgi:hypothetical protein